VKPNKKFEIKKTKMMTVITKMKQAATNIHDHCC
jgi:hypothetical protein